MTNISRDASERQLQLVRTEPEAKRGAQRRGKPLRDRPSRAERDRGLAIAQLHRGLAPPSQPDHARRFIVQVEGPGGTLAYEWGCPSRACAMDNADAAMTLFADWWTRGAVCRVLSGATMLPDVTWALTESGWVRSC